MAPKAAHRRQSGEHTPLPACAETPCKPAPGAAAALEAAVPQQWRQPAGMVLAAAALLLCAPYLWNRSPAVPLLVPVAVSRRHLQQPSVEPQPPGAHAARMTLHERAAADQHDRQHANDPQPGRAKAPPYQPPDSRFEPPVTRATLWNKAAAWAGRRPQHYPEGHVALCLAVKDQAADIAEWVEWHQLLGVRRMYVFDMGTEPPMNQTLQPYIESGLVEYHWVNKSALPARGAPGKQPPQLAIYDICIHEFRHRHAWMGVIDADEFLVLRNRSLLLPSFLTAYEAYGGLAVNWDTFGSSGHVTRPPGGTLKSYWRCMQHGAPHARHVKMLVNLRYAGRPYKDPHTFTYMRGRRAVNERYAFVDAPVHAYHTSEQIVLHHYVSRSLEENQEKMARGSGMLNIKPQAFFDAINSEATEDCFDGIHAAQELGFWPKRPAVTEQQATQLTAAQSPAAAAAPGDVQPPAVAPSPAAPSPAESEADRASVPPGADAVSTAEVQAAAEETAATSGGLPVVRPADSTDGGFAAEAVASIDAIIGALSSVAGGIAAAGSGTSTGASGANWAAAQPEAPQNLTAAGSSGTSAK